MPIIKVMIDGQENNYKIPSKIACAKDDMIAVFEASSKQYECCDCEWTMSAKDYIRKNNIQPEIEEENSMN
ncbi:MAG: hypothetical protein E7379_01340 [Clostridiales bacterium]|nr:hypothetical protein [Clostridiales bacterium]